MKLRNLLLTGAAAFAWAASIGSWGTGGLGVQQPAALARIWRPKVIHLMVFSSRGTYCDYCDGPACGCFLADSNGGTGSMKFDSAGPKNMGWKIELDYANNDQFDNGNYGSCWPASGFIETFTGARQGADGLLRYDRTHVRYLLL